MPDSSLSNKANRAQLIAQMQHKHLQAILSSRTDLSVAFKFWRMYGRKTALMWFHKRLAMELEMVQSRVTKRLIIQMPTQHGKSSFASIAFPMWCIGKQDEQIGIIAYNSKLSGKFNRAIRRLVQRPQYMQSFPDVKLPGSKIHGTPQVDEYNVNNSMIEFYESPSVIHTVGYSGGIGGEHLTIGVLDDPYKSAADADSEAYSDAIWEIFTDVIEERLHEDGVLVLPFSRWRENDLIGRVLKRDGTVEEGGLWRVVTFRSLREEMDNDPLDPRKVGEVLWPRVRTKEKVRSIELNKPRTFVSLHQQRPSKKGGSIVKRSWFPFYNPKYLDYRNKFIVDFYLDTALTDERQLKKSQGNPSTSSILVYAAINGRCYAVDYLKGYWSFPELVRRCKTVWSIYAMDRSIMNIENRANGASLEQQLRESAPEINALLDDVSVGKIQRLTMQQERLMTGKFVLPQDASWTESFLDNICIHPQGSTEEGDVTSGAMKKVFDENQRPTQDYSNIDEYTDTFAATV